MNRESFDKATLGQVTTAGSGGCFLVIAARASENEAIIGAASYLAPVVSALMIWAIPRFRLWLLLWYNRKALAAYRKRVQEAKLPPEVKERFAQMVQALEERLLHWETAFFPTEDLDPRMAAPPQIEKSFGLRPESHDPGK